MSTVNINFKKMEKCFIIAEIGQNHQGNIQLAKQLIQIAKDSGADCVKFQKTDLNEKFNKAALDRPYISPHSFGATYGEHKRFLEFSKSQFKELQTFAKETDILFTASAMDVISFDLLMDLNVPFIKIGSGDANNFLLIEKAAITQIPLVISTGMQSFQTVKKIYQTVSKFHTNFALLQCVSAYPTPLEDIHLNVINLYKEEFPDITIGYSGHEIGTHISVATVAMGAKIVEKHITINKNWKGSDHQCSLEPKEFSVLVNNIRSLEKALGNPEKIIQSSEILCYKKLGKSLVYSKDFPKEHILCFGDINVKVAVPKGIDGSEIEESIGKVLKKPVKKDESVNIVDFV